MVVTRRCSDAPVAIIFSVPLCSSSVNPYTAAAAAAAGYPLPRQRTGRAAPGPRARRVSVAAPIRSGYSRFGTSCALP